MLNSQWSEENIGFTIQFFFLFNCVCVGSRYLPIFFEEKESSDFDQRRFLVANCM